MHAALSHAGTATVAGYDVADHPEEVRIRIGAALQEAALDDRQTGRELLVLQGRLYGLRSAAIDRRLTEVLDLVDIGGAIDRRIGTYSGGMKRRLDLAASLIHNPQVLFLDEPTTGLDPASRSSVWAEVKRLNTQLGMTIFLTTQYLEEADALAHRVGIIDRGALSPRGRPKAEALHGAGRDRGRSRGGDHRPWPGSGTPRRRRRSPWTGPDHHQHLQRPGDLSPIALSLGCSRRQQPDLADTDPRRRLRGAHRIAHRIGRSMTHPATDTVVVAREAGFLRDVVTIAGRALADPP